MNEAQALQKMIAPGQRRPGKYREGVIQIWVTRACDKACFGCTQGSNLGGKSGMITPAQFERAVASLVDYFGVVGMFGGNPAMHPEFEGLCDLMAKYIPYERRGLWCNNPLGKGKAMQRTFNPRVSNLNVHLDGEAFKEFKRDWPESMPFGFTQDSRHSPPFVAMKDILLKDCPECYGRGYLPAGLGGEYRSDCPECDATGKVSDESKAWDLISNCDINQHWSAMIGVFRGSLRAWFCEIAGAQAMLHQHEESYPDTGLPVTGEWWQRPMADFAGQVRKHCHECGVPLRGYGELAQAKEGREQVSETHKDIYQPKRAGRMVELVTIQQQLGNHLDKMTDYLGNANR